MICILSSPFLPKMPPPSSPFLPRLSLSVSTSISPSASASISTTSFDLRTYWSSLLPEINTALSLAVRLRPPESIHNAIRYSLLSPQSKRAPPILCLASAELLGAPRSLALPAALALEMVHSASLIHDDLPCFDSSPLRRGRPSTHLAFGVDFAVLAADALFPLAFETLINYHPSTATPLPAQLTLRLMAEIARAVGSTGMAAGQFLDLNYDNSDEGQVMFVLEKKFGEMAECSAVCGGIVGGANEEEVDRLRRYGRAVGVLYQVVDDVLMEENGGMRSNASVVRAVGMERALEIVEELRAKAKMEIKGFEDKCGERVLPLYSFVDYAVERGFVVDGGVGDDDVGNGSSKA